MGLLPNLRARLEEAFKEHAEDWRPGGAAPAHPGFDAEPVREQAAAPAAAPSPSPRPSAAPFAATSRPPAAPARGNAAHPVARGNAALSPASLAARLRSPHALREAFVVKEILDLPVGLRPLRGRRVRS